MKGYRLPVNMIKKRTLRTTEKILKKIAITSTGTACVFIAYESKIPKEVMEYQNK